MDKQEIPVLVAGLVEYQSAFGSLPEKDAEWVVKNTREAIKLFIGAVKNRSKLGELLLGPAGEAIAGTVLRVRPLLQSSTDHAIIAELGGYLKARITLEDIDQIKNSGAIMNGGPVYIGYVEERVHSSAEEAFSYINESGQKCMPRVVCFQRRFGEWLTDDRSLGDFGGWVSGSRILSRVPVVA